jgi:phage tail-like protein
MSLVETGKAVRRAEPEPRSTWLIDQLPGCMASDPLLRRFVTIFQLIADDMCDRIDDVQYAIEPGLAPPAFRHWLTGWLGIPGLDHSTSTILERDLIEATGRSLRQRGTAAGLHSLLVAITGEPVTICDSGRVFRGDDPEEAAAPSGRLVHIEVPTTGEMDEREFIAFVRRELPAHAGLELFVGGERVFPAFVRRRPE